MRRELHRPHDSLRRILELCFDSKEFMMPRGSIPEHLKHRPEEVRQNAARFDQLCEIVEEISGPIVREALIEETKTDERRGSH